MELRKTIILIFVVILVIALIYIGSKEPEEPEEPLTSFQKDLMYWGVEEKMAKNIDLYFRGEREYLTWTEMKAVIDVYNVILQDMGEIEFINTTGIESVVEDLNSLIGEVTP